MQVVPLVRHDSQRTHMAPTPSVGRQSLLSLHVSHSFWDRTAHTGRPRTVTRHRPLSRFGQGVPS